MGNWMFLTQVVLPTKVGESLTSKPIAIKKSALKDCGTRAKSGYTDLVLRQGERFLLMETRAQIKKQLEERTKTLKTRKWV